ncbi:sodium-translocating pyrophosphatase, partial [Candidatus Micrarchaeota archaeon]|nr:sodium-translocating pyrophosphatase [Candidatus Micrarchaeota archaeon]
ALTFLLGAVFSGIAGYFGMNVAVKANVRTAQAAKSSLDKSLRIAFSAGTVNGMLIVGLGLLGVSIIYIASYLLFIPQGPDAVANVATDVLVGFGFGACLLALFMRVGGGIYTKAADVGADLVGKVEKGIPEDDPRNPATIADNVGDNVGDCAGMGADVFESYAVTIVAAMILGGVVFGLKGVVFPLLVRSAAILSAIFGTFFVKAKKGEHPMGPINRGFMIANLSAGFFFLVFAYFLFGDLRVFAAAATGLVATQLIAFITEYYTSVKKKPVQGIALASKTGAGTNIITGIAVGMESTVASVLVVAATIFFGYYFMGYYGIALAGMGMLATTGIIMSMDTYGPIADNASGIGEMAKMDKKARKIMASLDAVGNTTKALTKGFAISSAAVAAVSLFSTYFEQTNLSSINISIPNVFIGLLLGGAIPFIFSSMTIKAVGRAAFLIVEEVRRQFKEMPGIMKGTTKPQYAKIVDITTEAALKELILPAVIVVSAPVLVGILFGLEALGGFLAGAILSSQLLAVFMCNSGGAWDNAKKLIEDGLYGGKGTPTHAAAVVGDTVGDPLKDTAGPALNPMVKIINIISLLFAAFWAARH